MTSITVDWFQGKKITLMGLGLHGGGLAVAQWLLKHGTNITVTDLKTAEELKSSVDILLAKAKELGVENNLILKLGKHSTEDFVDTDMVIKNPGVRNNNNFLEIARDNNIPIYDEAMLFMELTTVPIIGITGSKGKSTVTAITGAMLQKKFPKTIIAGNIKTTPLFQIIDKVIDNEDILMVVAELSSWQLDNFGDIEISPQIAVITNLLPEHLNSYNNSFIDYINAKFNIAKFQKTEDTVVLNYDDKKLKEYGKSLEQNIIWFSVNSKVPKGVEVRGDELIWHEESVEKSLGKFVTELAGNHNLANIAAATSVAYAHGVETKDIIETIKKFQTLSGRREYFGNVHDRIWYNDTTATAPVATMVMLDSFSDRVVLIAGGSDKGSPIDDLAKKIIEKVSHLILLPGDGTDKLVNSLEKNNFTNRTLVKDMSEAVQVALDNSKKDETIILSPGFASFASFAHEFARGDAYIQAINDKK